MAINKVNVLGTVYDIGGGSGGGGSLYTYTSNNYGGDIMSAAIGCVDKNGIYHEYDTNIGYSNYDLNFKMIGFIAKNILSTKIIEEISNLYNLTKNATATTTNISEGDVIILTGDAVLNWYYNDQ